MAVFTFTGDPNANGRGPAGDVFGVSYEPGVPFSVTDSEIIKKFRRHSHFTETGGAANLGDFDGDGEPGGSAIVFSGLKAIHKGRGKFVIIDGAKDVEVRSGLTKDEADAFNALTPDQQVDYLRGEAV